MRQPGKLLESLNSSKGQNPSKLIPKKQNWCKSFPRLISFRMIMHSENSASKHKFVFVEDPAQLSWPCVSIKSWRNTICKDTKVRFLGPCPLNYAAPNVSLSVRNLSLITFAVLLIQLIQRKYFSSISSAVSLSLHSIVVHSRGRGRQQRKRESFECRSSEYFQ